jgi:hypothetical protein
MATRKRASRSRDHAKPRLWGAPEPDDFKKSKFGRVLGEAAKIHFKNRRDIDRLLALEKLAIDIFSDSRSARAFATNPQEYMAQSGFPNVKLDLNSIEVRLAMAMGDPKVRVAAAQGDVVGFVRAVMDQGLKDLSVGVVGRLFVVEIVAAGSVVTRQAVLTRALVITKAIAITELAIATDVDVVTSGGTPIAFGGATFVDREVSILSRMAEDLGKPQLVKAIRSQKIRKVLQQYGQLAKKVG